MPSNSEINMGLPLAPLTTEPVLFSELTTVYNALRILQQVMDDAGIVPGPPAVIPVASGGTGIVSYTIGDMIYASGTTALSKLAAVASGKVLTSNGIGVAPSWQVPTPGASGRDGITMILQPDEPDEPLIIIGPTGSTGATGTTGQTGSEGRTYWIEQDPPDEPLIIRGDKGDKGDRGQVVWMEPDQPEEPIIIIGPTGATGAIGATGLTVNTIIYLETGDAPDEPIIVPPSSGGSGSGQMEGNATNKAIFYNAKTIAENITIVSTHNGLSAGPITISGGFAVTVAAGAIWKIL